MVLGLELLLGGNLCVLRAWRFNFKLSL